jgi:hypothetical protein
MPKRPSELRPEWEALKQDAAALAAEGAAQRGLPADDPQVEAQEGLCDVSLIKLIEAVVAVGGGWSPRP